MTPCAFRLIFWMSSHVKCKCFGNCIDRKTLSYMSCPVPYPAGCPLFYPAGPPIGAFPISRLSPTRGRAGWGTLAQGDFIGFLAETGSVTEAARRVGLSKECAYRLRRAGLNAAFRLRGSSWPESLQRVLSAARCRW